MLEISQYGFAIALFLAGVMHLWKPAFFLYIMPVWVPLPEATNQFVGLVEMVLAVALLVPLLEWYAVWGTIALLIAVFPANINHTQKAWARKQAGKKNMFWLTVVRLPLQAVLIWWVYSFLG